MTVAVGAVCLTLNLSGKPVHWFRYYRMGKLWRAACGQAVSEYERQHTAIRKPRAGMFLCAECNALLALEISQVDERARMWERLFHEPTQEGPE